MRTILVWLLKLIAFFDESIAHQAPQSLHPHWCNLHDRKCLFHCGQVCLDADLPWKNPVGL